jgi:transcriptional regulator with XRE-family HTH domain
MSIEERSLMQSQDVPGGVAAASRALRIESLAQQMHRTRVAQHLTLEDVHGLTGISIATLSRFERWRHAGDKNAKAMPEPDAKTLAAVSRWLGVSLDSLLVGHQEHLTAICDQTPDIVEAYLRADRNLNSQAANALSTLFRAAYEQFAERSNHDHGNSASEPDEQNDGVRREESKRKRE